MLVRTMASQRKELDPVFPFLRRAAFDHDDQLIDRLTDGHVGVHQKYPGHFKTSAHAIVGEAGDGVHVVGELIPSRKSPPFSSIWRAPLTAPPSLFSSSRFAQNLSPSLSPSSRLRWSSASRSSFGLSHCFDRGIIAFVFARPKSQLRQGPSLTVTQTTVRLLPASWSDK